MPYPENLKFEHREKMDNKKELVVILCVNKEKKEVYFLGFGKLLGYEIPGEEAGGLAVLTRAYKIPNPKIQLDNGKIVWGCECHWGNKKEMLDFVAELEEYGYKKVDVDIDDVRKNPGLVN